jgi:pyruvate kinase
MSHSKAQIIVPLNASNNTLEDTRTFIEYGMDVALIDFAQGSIEDHRQSIEHVRTTARSYGRKIPIVGLLEGPKKYQPAETILSPCTQKDEECIAFSVEQESAYIALPYVGQSEDVSEVRAKLETHGANMKIIAVIERAQALRDLDNIIKNADGILIDRVGLGEKIPIEQIPFIEHTIITKVRWSHLPVIVMGGILSTMATASEPSRAEVADVAHVAMSGADGIALSHEAAFGEHRARALQSLERVVLEAERHSPPSSVHTL